MALSHSKYQIKNENEHMKKLFLLLALTVALVTKADHHEENTSSDNTAGAKSARKPWNYLFVDYMDVADGKEEDYVKAEGLWLKVHESWAQEGRILAWGLAKARKNTLGIEYITWKIAHSREDVVGLYDMEAIERILGTADFETISSLTGPSRSIVGSEILKLSDYTLREQGSSFGELKAENLAFHWNFMTPSEGKYNDYMEVEHKYAQPWAQAKVEHNPRFIGWDLQEVVSSNGDTHSSKVRTVDLFRKDVPLSDSQIEEINEKISDLKIWPENLDVPGMRKMERVTFDVIYKTDQSKNGVAKLWNGLEGTWTAQNPGGNGYRTKTITPYNEKLQWFNRQGELQGTAHKPLSVEFANKIPTFTIYRNDGQKAFSIPFELKNGKWIEYAGFANPKWSTFTYEKTDKPVYEELYTQSGPDVELMKKLIKSYAAGDFEVYRSLFVDEPNISHNSWGGEAKITVDQLVENHKAHHQQLSKPIEITNSIYEVVTLKNGSKHGHAWVNFKHTYKTGEEVILPGFVALGINDDSKFWYEWAFYDTGLMPSKSPYNKKE